MSKHSQIAKDLLNMAIKTQYGVYNIKDGQVIFPDMNWEGKLYGFQMGVVPLKTLVEAKRFEPACADEYVAENFPAPGTCAENKLDFIPEQAYNLDFVQYWHGICEDSTSCDEVLSILDKDVTENLNEFPWCISDSKSIIEKAEEWGLYLYDKYGHHYEVVKEAPLGYSIWNVGSELLTNGYLPFCRLKSVQPFDGACEVDIHSLKALKCEGTQEILKAIGYGPKNSTEMKDFTKKHTGKKRAYICERMKKAVPYLEAIGM